MIVLINQFSTPLFVDVVNAFQEKEEVRYVTGGAEIASLKINPGVNVIRSISYRRSNLITRFLTWSAFTLHAAIYLATVRRPSAVVVVTNPPLMPWIAGVIANWRRIRFYPVIYDLYPDVLVQAGLMTVKHPTYRLCQKLNHSMFSRAQKIFTLSDSMKQAVAAYLDGLTEKILVVHNWANTNNIKPVNGQDNPFTREHNLCGKLIVLYAGNMGLTHDLESVMNAAVMLKEMTDVKFVFIGDGGKYKLLKDISSRNNLGNVIFLPFVEEERFPYAVAAGDIGIVTLGKGAEGISVPSKTYVNMAAGLCLLAIAPEESELARIVRKYEAGIMVTPGHPEKVAQCIVRLKEDRALLSEFKSRSRRAALDHTPDNALRYVEAVIQPFDSPTS